MKRNQIIIIGFVCLIGLTGCTKYEKDTAHDTTFFGTYTSSSGSEDSIYFLKESFEIYDNNTFNEKAYEKINDKVTKDYSWNGKIKNAEHITNDIIKVEFDNNAVEYNYKNMLGTFWKTDVPEGENFDLIIPYDSKTDGKTINDGLVYKKDGTFHYCFNYTDCPDKDDDMQHYVRKDNIIYFKQTDNSYSIYGYIVPEGIFYKEFTKVENNS